ncbi:MAG: hypothetical protein ACI82H_001112 [Alphaproteobacteria bacterium]|jgi:hypothetical protein
MFRKLRVLQKCGWLLAIVLSFFVMPHAYADDPEALIKHCWNISKKDRDLGAPVYT